MFLLYLPIALRAGTQSQKTQYSPDQACLNPCSSAFICFILEFWEDLFQKRAQILLFCFIFRSKKNTCTFPKIKRTQNTKCGQRCKATTTHSCTVQPYTNGTATVENKYLLRTCKYRDTDLPYDPAILLIGIYPREINAMTTNSDVQE